MKNNIGSRPYFFMTVLLCTVVLFSCADQKPEEGEGQTSDSAVASQETSTPSGRAQLPTFRTAVPDLWMTLPEGFTVRADTMLPYDIIVVADNNDPLLHDSTQTPLGMLRVVVSDSTIRLALPGEQGPSRKAIVGDYFGVWNSSTVALPNGTTYYSYEMVADDFFARMYPEREIKDFGLHLYIGGKDSARTEQLLKAVESISIKP